MAHGRFRTAAATGDRAPATADGTRDGHDAAGVRDLRRQHREGPAPGNRRDRECAALERVRQPVEGLLDAFLDDRVEHLTQMDPALRRVGEEIAGLVTAPSKRLRPAFVYWGYRAGLDGAGTGEHMGVFAPAAAVELLHTFALIHDDIMDRSPERRGRPAVHAALAAAHAQGDHLGDPWWFGVGGGILAGDLAFVWADQLFDSADLAPEALDRARTVFGALRVEVMAGQYLDLRLSGLPDASEEDAMRVALLKSGRYTVTRPLQMGAAIAGCTEDIEAALCAYGDAVGLAFQLRDDVLGIFGDPATTGKGSLEDLREGKRTVVVLRALAMTDEAGRRVLLDALGNPGLDEAAAVRVREVIATSGALDTVERLCTAQHDTACAALAPLHADARGALEELADLALFRDA